MMAMPKTTPWMPGRMSPSSACKVSLTGIRIAAPITGPHSVPTPPNSVTISACEEVRMPKTLSGVTTSSTTA